MTLTNSVAKSGVVTGNVPSDGGVIFLRPKLPAMASIGIIIMKRPNSIASPIVVLYQSVLALSPANAEPLLPVPDVKAYRISDKPCGPLLLSDVRPNESDIAEIAVKTRMKSGKIST
jgi:hypothetical protein